MHSFLRWNLIFGLICVSLVASLFMILEAGSFYQRLYPEQIGWIPLGFLAAGLNEVFMSIMAGAKLEHQGKPHPINYFFRFLMLLLFITTVGGASFNLVYDKIQIIQDQTSHQKVIELLKKQIEDQEKNFATFIQQNQRLNTAVTAKRKAEARQALIQAVRKNKPLSSLWFEVIFILTLRLGVQMANLSCVWLAGWLYRAGKEPKKQTQAWPRQEIQAHFGLTKASFAYQKALQTAPALPVQLAQPNPFPLSQSQINTKTTPKKKLPTPVPKPTPQPVAKHTPLRQTQEESTPQTPSQPRQSAKEQATIQPAVPQKGQDARPRTEQRPNLPTTTHPRQKTQAAKEVTAPTPKQTEPIPPPTPVLEAEPVQPPPPEHLAKVTPIQPKIEERKLQAAEKEQEAKEDLRFKINQLLSQRNQDVGLSQFCRSLCLDFNLILAIDNRRQGIENLDQQAMESIFHRMKEIYEEQSAQSY